MLRSTVNRLQQRMRSCHGLVSKLVKELDCKSSACVLNVGVRVPPNPPKHYPPVAQLVERLSEEQKVIGSIPILGG